MNEQELVIINRQFSPNCSKRLMRSELLLQLEPLKVQNDVMTRMEHGDSQTASPSRKRGRGFDPARGDGDPGRRRKRGSGGRQDEQTARWQGHLHPRLTRAQPWAPLWTGKSRRL